MTRYHVLTLNLIDLIVMCYNFNREVNLNADKKRFWLGEIESIDSKIMNESMPISMNYFEKDEI